MGLCALLVVFTLRELLPGIGVATTALLTLLLTPLAAIGIAFVWIKGIFESE